MQWDKKLSTIERTETGVRATFEDGTTANGGLVVGADGAWSAVRRMLAPGTYPVVRLPCTSIGRSDMISEENVCKLRTEVDLLYFFGADPKTDTYTFWSMLEQPKEAGGMYKIQLYLS